MKKLFSRLDKPLLITTIIFFIFGAIMIQSASSMESFMRYNYSPYHYFVRELIFLAIGTVFFLFTIIFPTKNYKKVYSFLLFLEPHLQIDISHKNNTNQILKRNNIKINN